MRESDALEIMAVVQAAYPRQPWPTSTVKLFASELMRLEVDPQRAAAAVLRRLRERSSEWAPTHSELLDAIVTAMDGAPSFEAAWAEMRANASAGDYFRPDRLPPLSHPAVERLAELIGWATFCRSHTDDAFLKRNAERIYATVRADRASAALEHPTKLHELLGPRSVGELPEPVRELVSGIGEGEDA